MGERRRGWEKGGEGLEKGGDGWEKGEDYPLSSPSFMYNFFLLNCRYFKLDKLEDGLLANRKLKSCTALKM